MKRYVQYHWWKYLLAVLLPVIVWLGIFDAVGKPKKNECLRIIFIGETLNAQTLQDELSEAIPQMTDQPLKEITVTQTLPTGFAIGELLTARQFDYDIVILKASDCPELVGQNFFSPLSEQMTARFTDSALYLEPVDNTELPYGFLLSGKTRFASRLTAQTDCILFFSSETVNAGTLNGKGKAGDDAALCAAKYLLEEPD